jgi:hypothetical protein
MTLPIRFRSRGRHAAGRHAAPKRAPRHTRKADRLDDYDAMTIALYTQWNLPLHIVRRIVGSTLAATRSFDAALRMTELIRLAALAGA